MHDTLELLGRVLDRADLADTTDDTYLEDLPDLDSLAFVRVIEAVEAAIGSKLSTEQLAELETVGDLRALLSG